MKHKLAAVRTINNVCYVCDGLLLECLSRLEGGGGGLQISTLNTSRLLSVRVSQNSARGFFLQYGNLASLSYIRPPEVHALTFDPD